MAALTATEICNLALLKVGNSAGFLTDLGSDNSAQADACNRAYVPCRDELQEIFPWSFTLTRAALAASPVAPAWGYTTAFVKPPEFLRLVSVEGQGAQYEVEGDFILSDEDAPFLVRYQRLVTDTSKFPPTWAQALAYRIALEICPALAVSNTRIETLASMYKQALAQAKRVDRMGISDRDPLDGSWNDARL